MSLCCSKSPSIASKKPFFENKNLKLLNQFVRTDSLEPKQQIKQENLKGKVRGKSLCNFNNKAQIKGNSSFPILKKISKNRYTILLALKCLTKLRDKLSVNQKKNSPKMNFSVATFDLNFETKSNLIKEQVDLKENNSRDLSLSQLIIQLLEENIKKGNIKDGTDQQNQSIFPNNSTDYQFNSGNKNTYLYLFAELQKENFIISDFNLKLHFLKTKGIKCSDSFKLEILSESLNHDGSNGLNNPYYNPIQGPDGHIPEIERITRTMSIHIPEIDNKSPSNSFKVK